MVRDQDDKEATTEQPTASCGGCFAFLVLTATATSIGAIGVIAGALLGTEYGSEPLSSSDLGQARLYVLLGSLALVSPWLYLAWRRRTPVLFAFCVAALTFGVVFALSLPQSSSQSVH